MQNKGKEILRNKANCMIYRLTEKNYLPQGRDRASRKYRDYLKGKVAR